MIAQWIIGQPIFFSFEMSRSVFQNPYEFNSILLYVFDDLQSFEKLNVPQRILDISFW